MLPACQLRLGNAGSWLSLFWDFFPAQRESKPLAGFVLSLSLGYRVFSGGLGLTSGGCGLQPKSQSYRRFPCGIAIIM